MDNPHERSPERVIARTQAWVELAVIGLNLCPFAKAVQVKGQLRYVCSNATDTESLLEQLRSELERLVATPAAELETTLLIHPEVLTDFADFNLFLPQVQALLKREGYLGEFQVASFHPEFQFAGVDAQSLGNATNRAPYPTLHLLRETSLDRAVAAFPEAEMIYETNIRTLEALGAQGWSALQEKIRDA